MRTSWEHFSRIVATETPVATENTSRDGKHQSRRKTPVATENTSRDGNTSRDILLLSTGVRLMRIKQSLRQCLATSIFLGGAFIALFETLNVYKSFLMTSAVDLGEQSLIYGAGGTGWECLTSGAGCVASGTPMTDGDPCTGTTTVTWCDGQNPHHMCMMTGGSGFCTMIPPPPCFGGTATCVRDSNSYSGGSWSSSTSSSGCGTHTACL
jgi:hypothetical protein